MILATIQTGSNSRLTPLTALHFFPQNKVPWGTQERAGLSGMGNSIIVASIKAESEAEAEAALAT